MEHYVTNARHESARATLERVSERLLEYVRTRSAQEWVIFLTGLAFGLLIG